MQSNFRSTQVHELTVFYCVSHNVMLSSCNHLVIFVLVILNWTTVKLTLVSFHQQDTVSSSTTRRFFDRHLSHTIHERKTTRKVSDYTDFTSCRSRLLYDCHHSMYNTWIAFCLRQQQYICVKIKNVYKTKL